MEIDVMPQALGSPAKAIKKLVVSVGKEARECWVLQAKGVMTKRVTDITFA